MPLAEIYSREEHGIDMRDIDLDAIWAIRKLKQSGAQAYIVGGAIRDLLLGRKPKDFDIATSASPRQVQKMFWNARIIGKRFKLVHLIFKDKVLEISTFRSGEDGSDGPSTIYGTAEQDAKRRDFSVNSLYFDPIDGTIIDYNHAMDDFKKERIRSVLPLPESFIEDPVRMVRAIKYAVTTGFSLQGSVKRTIKRYANELARVSTSRLTEEVVKILGSGASAPILRELQRYRLLVYMLPCLSVYTDFPEVNTSLRALDAKIIAAQNSGSKTIDNDLEKGEMLKALTKPMIVFQQLDGTTPEELFKETYRQIKVLVSPITPPNYDVEVAAMMLLKDAGYDIPKHCIKTRKPINRAPFQGRGKRKEASHKPRKTDDLQNMVRKRTKRRRPKPTVQDKSASSEQPMNSN